MKQAFKFNVTGRKRIAAFLLITFVGQTIAPTTSYALTGGPSQPEVESFEPVSTNQMVDTFTGDFTYNIPLLTVPGPNGGYPINIAYHAGIGMEEEASWVGLGWNLNVGAITRTLRGVPDDFNGTENITRQQNLKAQTNAAIDFPVNFNSGEFEIFGQEIENMRANVSLDSYRGLGLKFVFNKLDNQKEVTVQTTHELVKVDGKFEYISNQNFKETNVIEAKSSAIGIQALKRNLKMKLNEYIDKDCKMESKHGLVYRLGSLSQKRSFHNGCQIFGASYSKFSQASSFPTVTAPRNMFTGQLEISKWTTPTASLPEVISPSAPPIQSLTWNEQWSGEGSFSRSFLPEEAKNQTIPAVGLFYAHKANENSLQDFTNVAQLGSVSKRTPALGIPVQNHDVFDMCGQGLAGSFRTYRCDFGIYNNPKIVNITTGVMAGGEFGISTPPGDNDLGVDLSLNVGSSYDGPWLDNNGISDLQFDSNQGLTERSYLKMAGELTSGRIDIIPDGHRPSAFDIEWGAPFNTSLLDLGENAESSYYQEPIHLGKGRIDNSSGVKAEINDVISERTKRQNSIQYKRIDEIVNHTEYTDHTREAKIFGSNNEVNIYENNDVVPSSQIGEYEVVSDDGMRYVYGLPVYNLSHNKMSFEFGNENTSISTNPNLIEPYYYANANHIDNDNGQNHSYYKETLPAYAHSFMLTEIYSPDYVDVKGDGPTEDDFGYYCIFEYDKIEDYFWRSPYQGAYYSKGDYSNNMDDKGSYEYGTKDVYYLSSIQTKTHIAKFICEERLDAEDAPVDNRGDLTNDPRKSLLKLKRIELYSSQNMAVPLKEVHFAYNYQLCPGIPNSSGTGTNMEGKLTLTQISFTYQNNNKGQLTPYVFTYVNGNPSSQNPAYDYLKVDRWGNYSPVIGNQENPYTEQDDRASVDSYSSSWCLREIKLPSGSSIHIQYESDDYGFVQDKKVTRMFKIVGTASMDNSTQPPNLSTSSIDVYSAVQEKISIASDRTVLLFELENGITDIQKYMPASQDEFIYFKAFVDINKNSMSGWTGHMYDYVEGWAKYNDFGTVTYNGSTYGYVELVKQEFGSSLNPILAHPIRAATWEYMRSEREDLFMNVEDSQINLSDIPEALVNLIQEFPNHLQRLISFYGMANLMGWGNALVLKDGTETDTPPSFIRLLDPNQTKIGGGIRVKQLSIRDSWFEDNDRENNVDFKTEYGQTYTYTLDGLPTGPSSGVAQYEPILGGEENPCKTPIYFNDSNQPISFRTANQVLEEPLTEPYYPSALVGYSKVTVRNIVPPTMDALNENNVNGSFDVSKQAVPGRVVYEFYTAKDFPVYSMKSNLSKTENTLKSRLIPVYIPGIGCQVFQDQVYSQGYYVELNDMHGKLKSTSGFPNEVLLPGTDQEIQPSVKTEYLYSTLPDNPKRLNSVLPSLNLDGSVTPKSFGETFDFFSYMSEHSSYLLAPGGNFNIIGGLSTNGFPLPSAGLNADYSQSSFRSVATTKVVYKTGILTEVRNYIDGASSTTINEKFDPETGQPVLTKTYNEWGVPIYNHTYMAHRYYGGMNGAYTNYRAIFSGSTISNGQITFSSVYTITPEGAFFPGDELQIREINGLYQTGYAFIENNSVVIRDENDQLMSFDDPVDVTIIRSGQRNQQSTVCGSVVTLGNSTMNPYEMIAIEFTAALQDIIETALENNTVPNISQGSFQFSGSNDPLEINWTFESSTNQLIITVLGCDEIVIELPQHAIDGIENGAVLVTDVVFSDGHFEIEILPCATIQAFVNPTEPPCDLIQIENGVSSSLGPTHEGTNLINTETFELSPEIISCLSSCMQVLQASAVTYKDIWNYNYDDVDAPLGENNQNLKNDVNEYRFGKFGIWRPYRNYAYQEVRDRSGDLTNFKNTKIGEDGVFLLFEEFDWENEQLQPDALAVNPNWIWTSEATKYSPYGFGLEEKNALGIYSSQLYGYNNSLVTAAASNARYEQIGFDSFEEGDYSSGSHLRFINGSQENSKSHTGKYSLSVDNSAGAIHTIPLTNNFINYNLFAPLTDPGSSENKYLISAWVFTGGGTDGSIEITANAGNTSNLLGTISTANSSALEIDGWTRIELAVEFDLNAGYTSFILKLKSEGSANTYFDDVRIHPFDGAFESYVYDLQTYRLLASLDNNNYATFYIYDEEGKLVQKKIETERGVQTALSARSNVARP